MQLNHYCFICSIKNLKSSDSDFLRCIPDVHICSANGDINKKIQKKTKLKLLTLQKLISSYSDAAVFPAFAS